MRGDELTVSAFREYLEGYKYCSKEEGSELLKKVAALGSTISEDRLNSCFMYVELCHKKERRVRNIIAHLKQ